MDFDETYDKKIRNKSIVLFVFVQLMIYFGIYLLSPFNNEFLVNNATFFYYLLFFLLFIIVYGALLITSFKKIDWNNIKYLVIFVFTTLFFMVISAIIIDKLGIINNSENSSVTNDNYILRFIASVLFAPIVEELMFRFFIFRATRKINIVFAHLFTAFIFAFSHIWDYVLIDGDYTQLIAMIPYVILGLNASFVYSKTKNICFPIFLHMIINFISMT